MRKRFVASNKSARVLSIAAFLILVAIVHLVSAIEVAKFGYKGPLEDFNGDTIIVSDTMIALSNEIFVKTNFSVGKDTTILTPSIMFVIDNSGSMGGGAVLNQVTDPNGNRFTVTSVFIDTIFKNFPGAQIGVAIFGGVLYFDPNDRPFFATCPAQARGAYVPLLKLDSTYSAFGNQTGYAILKNILDTTKYSTTSRFYSDWNPTISPSYDFVNLKYRPTDTTLRNSKTNITAGFDAVRCAFAGSTAPKEAQYVIFLSDGEATQQSGSPNEFPAATNIPTTFTVYFNSGSSTTVPGSIATFTTNVRANNYSPRNDSSRAWAYNNQSSSQLFSFLMANVFRTITTSIAGNPAQLTISTQTSTSWSAIDSSFLFPSLFPLTGVVTPFTATIKYQFPNGDTLHAINFFVKRQPFYQITPPAMYVLKYWDRNLNLRFNNTRVTQVNGTMDSLELLFDYNPGTALYNYTNVKVQVYNQLGTVWDNETFTLSKRADTFSIKFKKTVSTLPIPGNGVFEIQGIAGDSLVAIFRNSENPKLPLDTLRIAVPLFVTQTALLTTAITGDLNGNGLIDRIQVSFSKGAILDNTMLSSFLVKGNGYVFPVDSITKINDSTYLLCLKEVKTAVPQTAWTPDLSITFVPEVQPVVNFRTTDGCPPVVWEVKKYIADDKRTHDTVKVFMSEKITGPAGGPFSNTTQPSSVFNIWMANGTTLVQIESMLDGIQGFYKIISDSILVFTMDNNKDLSTDNYININSVNGKIKDAAGNVPSEANQRVKVFVVYIDILTIFTGPNPARPSLSHPEQLKFEHNPNAVTWAKQGQGTVISLRNVPVPQNRVGLENVSASMKILDVVGNPVNWCKTEDVFLNAPVSGGMVPEMDIYWNGLNSMGMPVAPGVYRTILYINYPSSSKISNVKVISKVGIRH